MSSQSTPNFDDAELFAFIKLLSGKRIEQRRRRDRISQARLAAGIGRSERWVRELEAGISTSTLEDHMRCAHWLGMSTAHIFIPLLCAEHGIGVPHDLLARDDFRDIEELLLAAVASAQSRLAERSPVRSTRSGERGTIKRD